MRGRLLKWATALLAAGAGLVPLAHAVVYKAPDLTATAYPTTYDEYGRLVPLNGNCNQIRVAVRNLSPIAVTRSFEVEVFLGKKKGGQFVYYTGSRYKATFGGVPGGEMRVTYIQGFKITKALKGQGVYVVTVADSSGKVTEQNENNNRFGFFLTDHILDAAKPCK